MLRPHAPVNLLPTGLVTLLVQPTPVPTADVEPVTSVPASTPVAPAWTTVQLTPGSALALAAGGGAVVLVVGTVLVSMLLTGVSVALIAVVLRLLVRDRRAGDPRGHVHHGRRWITGPRLGSARRSALEPSGHRPPRPPDRPAHPRRMNHRAEHLLAKNPGALVLLVDLDDFKAVNDTHDHAAGDTVFVATADRLTDWCDGTRSPPASAGTSSPPSSPTSAPSTSSTSGLPWTAR
ncbi:diguanylate cyclase domain-containing protein [Streptomyces sp. NPDC098101]|uniref:diguanylate cyclase domain-containing protein n=1 Tax=Streptomyces sp. NPDC098101 TaxID=3366096 RepID=UPI003815D4B7